jgi:hypothetical protein
VISSSSRDADRPDWPSADTTESASIGLRNCAADRLTATDSLAGQATASMHAFRSTHSPSGTISPISSATGMN